MLCHFIRLFLFTLAVAFLFVRLVYGAKTVHAGLHHLVNHNERRDLCVFQFGLRFIERRVINGLSFSLSLCNFL